MSYKLDPYQDRRSVGPDLGPNCLQMLSADKKKSPLAWKELMVFITWEQICMVAIGYVSFTSMLCACLAKFFGD